MLETLVKLEKIEDLFIKADYFESYSKLLKLCNEDESCKEHRDSAAEIVRRFNGLQKNISNMILDLAQQSMEEKEICFAFRTTIKIIKNELNPIESTFYDEQISHMEGHSKFLKRSLYKIEEQYTDCDDTNKSKLLKKIIEKLEKAIRNFKRLINNFCEMKSYG